MQQTTINVVVKKGTRIMATIEGFLDVSDLAHGDVCHVIETEQRLERLTGYRFHINTVITEVPTDSKAPRAGSPPSPPIQKDRNRLSCRCEESNREGCYEGSIEMTDKWYNRTEQIRTTPLQPMTKVADVLDHGYVAFVEHWGADQRIVEAARMSTDGAFRGWGPKKCAVCFGRGILHDGPCSRCKGTKTVPGDEGLLRYLYGHRHETPFEMAGMVLEIQAPIFVFREWMRHRTQSYNELSARYTPIPDSHYTPSAERCLLVQPRNKQAMSADGSELLTHDAVLEWLRELEASYSRAQFVYQMGLKIGIPKEVARCPMPVARYSRMRASANLRNWLAFLTLRMDKHAQWEIRQFANVVGSIIEQLYPRTWELFNGRKTA